MLVMKFGGSVMRTPKDVQSVVEFLEFNGQGNVVVVSAIKGITDLLLDMAHSASKGDEKGLKSKLSRLKEIHQEVLELLDLGGVIEEDLNLLERVLTGIFYLGELSPKSKDFVASFGERLIGKIVSKELRRRGLNARFLMGGEAGIVTDDRFGDANPLYRASEVYIRNRIEALLPETLPIIAGFTGETQDGRITTLGRGGSDLTATLIGAALKADEVVLWADVDGLLSVSPKVVERPKVLRTVSYREAIELSFFGAKGMHPKFLEPAMRREVPVRIRNFWNMEDPGTLISKEEEVKEGVVKAVGLRDGVSIITVRGVGMVGRPGTAGRLFTVLGEHDVNVLMISQSVSESSISFVVDGKDSSRASNVLEDILLGPIFSEVIVEDGLSVVAAIGAGMRGTPGVAARVFRAVADRGINVKMISQGSSEINISFVVDGKDGVEAARAIYEEFKL